MELIGRDLAPNEFYVKLGHTSQPFDPQGMSYNVSRIFLHSEYNKTQDLIMNDIALLSLETRISINKYINPICLPQKELFNKLRRNDKLTLSGFGFAYDSSGKYYKPTFLQMTEDLIKLPIKHCLDKGELILGLQSH